MTHADLGCVESFDFCYADACNRHVHCVLHVGHRHTEDYNFVPGIQAEVQPIGEDKHSVFLCCLSFQLVRPEVGEKADAG